MKNKYLTFLLLFSTVFAHAQMKITGRFLYSQNSEKIIPRGVNEMFIYAADKSGYNIYPEIKKTGANMVRIMWNTTGTAQDLKNSIYNCVTRGSAIPVVTVNEATCNFGRLQECINYWLRADVKTAIMDFKKWTILNIANEAGDGSVTSVQFLSSYKSAITQLRNAGYTVPIMIDASGCGQNLQILKDNWSALLEHDPLKRIIFSAHTYWTDGGNPKFLDMVNYAKNNSMPFMFGEGPQQKAWDCNTGIDYKYVMQICQTNEIGWLAWSWGAVKNGDCQAARSHDLTTNGVYGNWVSQWSKDIIYFNAYSIQKASIRPASLNVTNPFARRAFVEPEIIIEDSNVYPNPIYETQRQKINVTLPNDEASEVSLELVDLMGNIIQQKSFNVESCSRNLDVIFEDVKEGTYIIRTKRGQKVTTSRLRIQD